MKIINEQKNKYNEINIYNSIEYVSKNQIISLLKIKCRICYIYLYIYSELGFWFVFL